MKQMKKLLSVLLAVLMVFSLMSTALAVSTEDSMEGTLVILHSNDVHGAVEGYAKIAALRDQLQAAGAEVILAVREPVQGRNGHRDDERRGLRRCHARQPRVRLRL